MEIGKADDNGRLRRERRGLARLQLKQFPHGLQLAEDSRRIDLGKWEGFRDVQSEIRLKRNFSGSEEVECGGIKVCLPFFKVTFINCLYCRISCT